MSMLKVLRFITGIILFIVGIFGLFLNMNLNHSYIMIGLSILLIITGIIECKERRGQSRSLPRF